MFDHNADGIKTGTGWLKPDDGWLALDLNKNGEIDTGRELFGVDTIKKNGQLAVNGFDALKELDSNNDGVIDKNDKEFNQLLIWQDKNQDGISQSNELLSLNALGISSISLNASSTLIDLGNGNVQTEAGTYTRLNGINGITGETTGASANLNLLINSFYSKFTTPIQLTDLAKSLPSLHGSGRVRNLNEAISLSPSLGALVQDFAHQTTRQGQVEKLDQFITQWADTSEMKSLQDQANNLTSSGVTLTYHLSNLIAGTENFNSFVKKMGVVERFMGFTYGGASGQARFEPLDKSSGKVSVTLSAQQMSSISQAYEKIKVDIFESLLLSTRFQTWVLAIIEGIPSDNSSLLISSESFEALINQHFIQNPHSAIIDLLEFSSSIGKNLFDALGWDITSYLIEMTNQAPDFEFFGEELSSWTLQSLQEQMRGSQLPDFLIGNSKDNSINGQNGNDILLGKKGNDHLYGDDGNDTLDGGSGNDYLSGGDGADVYLFGKGSGYDTISNYDSDTVNVNADTILLGAGITASDITLTRESTSLIISLNNSNDRLLVQSYFDTDGTSKYVVENLKFADGTIWDIATVKSKVLISSSNNDSITGYATNDTISAGDGNDYLHGQAGNDVLSGDAGSDNISGEIGNDDVKGGAGNDVLSGGEGHDQLQGNEENDRLDGNSGNDTLDGGSGQDYLYGGDGADVYLFGKGSGYDTISNYDSDTVNVNADTILLGAGITASDITLTRESTSLIISLNNSNDRLLVQSYFDTDGTSKYVVENLKFADGTIWDIATVKSKVLISSSNNDSITGYATNDTISAGDGNDYLHGQAGNDVLSGDAGSDNISGEIGNDDVKGGAGNDVLSGGEGHDQLQGNEENDRLDGNSGNDTLDGGSGQDYLYGGDGADVYLFGKGSGYDTISNYDSDTVNVNADTILLGAVITASDITLTRESTSLIISLNNSNDRLLVQSYFDTDGTSKYAVENLKFADGTIWNIATVKSKVLISSSNNDSITGYATNDTISAGDGNDYLHGQAGNDVLSGDAGSDNISGEIGNDDVKGGAGNDVLSGGEGHDQLQGNEENDRLDGNSGNDTLDGGSGQDYLYGGDGADVYLFGKGSGYDTISNYDSDTVNVNADTILLGAGITASDITLTRESTSLIISLNNSNDRLLVQSYFDTDGTSKYAVENLKFADGTIWNIATVKSKVLISSSNNDSITGYATNDTISAGDGNDYLYGQAGNDVLSGDAGSDNISGEIGNDDVKGGAGNDVLSGGEGHDQLQGNEENDRLDGNSGNDTLDGGSGQDYLYGGDGADVYLFGKGSGYDTISNYDSDTVNVNADTILLGAGITASDITLTRESTSLIISLNNSNDRLLVQSYFDTDGTSKYAVENLKFADGTIWNIATVKSKVLISSSNNDSITGYATNDTISAGDGNDYLHGQAGNDVLSGDAGSDNISGEIGNDDVKGGAGNDVLSGGEGHDQLQGNEENDRLDGNSGNDTLDGGSGQDYLYGGDGADVYLFGKGSGYDTISNYDSDTVNVNADTILLGAGITASDITLTRESTSLIISLNNSNDRLLVQSYFDTDGTSKYAVENLKFADGTIWNYSKISANLAIPAPQASTNISGTSTNDNLLGSSGNDTIYGSSGNDTLNGSSGNDYLDGGTGNDTYLFNRGSGNDTISSSDSTVGKIDVIKFGANILSSDVTVKRDSDALILYIKDSSDRLTIGSYFYNDATYGYQVEQIKFDDGTTWDINTVKTMAIKSTVDNDILYGYSTADSIVALAGDDTVYAKSGNDKIDGGDGEDNLYGEDGDDQILGGNQNDNINGGNGNDLLQGESGNDYLDGYAGNDTLDGGIGNDSLDGGTGNDTYLFNRGSGNDTISSSDSTVGKIDVIKFGANILSSDVTVKRDSDALILYIKDSSDRLTIGSYFYNDATYGYQVEQIKFDDGTTWDINTVKTMAIKSTVDNDILYGYSTADSIVALAGDDTVYAKSGNDKIDGGDGEDSLYGEDGDDQILGGNQNDNINGGNGNDLLQGESGNDYLDGYAGNDTLDGGIGNDSLDGGTGNDTYLFNRGSGNDTISSRDSTVGKIDVIKFGANILSSDVTVKRDSDALILYIKDSSDRLTIGTYFYNDATYGYQVEQIKFNDGTTWDINTVKTMAIKSTVDNDILYGYSTADSIVALAGDDTVYAKSGNDKIDGGDGEDNLYGEDGDDQILGGNQNDNINGGNGNDLLQGESGNDYLDGYAGNDTLDGGIGNDSLDGGTGNDTYLFNRGSGNDTISSHESTVGKIDTIKFGANILSTDVTVKRDSDALILYIKNSNDSLRVSGYFYNDATYGYQVEQIKFDDGTTWDINTVKTMAIKSTVDNDILYGYSTADSIVALAGDDTVYAKSGNDKIDGGDGEDSLYGEDGDDQILGGNQNDNINGGNGNDLLQGESGNDYLDGYAGNDTLDGGIGNDSLDGGTGNDTYLFNRGSGNDTISSRDSTVGKIDVIKFGANILSSDVTVKRDSDALILYIKDSSDRLTIGTYFYNDATYGYQVEQIKFNDGTTWDINTVKTMAIKSTVDNDILYGYSTADSIVALAGDDTVYAKSGNDKINGGDGEDSLYGEDGDDQILGGNQNDNINGGNGNDLLQGESGNDDINGSYENDTLDGGAGNDTLDGGYGNDAYLFGKGSGNDLIRNYSSAGADNDFIEIGADISENQIWLQHIGNDLKLTLLETNETLTIQSWYSGSAYHLDGIKLANGKHLMESKVESLVSVMASFSEPPLDRTALSDEEQTILSYITTKSWI